jgi:hypothetical protein
LASRTTYAIVLFVGVGYGIGWFAVIDADRGWVRARRDNNVRLALACCALCCRNNLTTFILP